MPSLVLLKATRDKKLWRKGQKLWVIFHTGACAAEVVTRFKGKGRWIICWAHWEDPEFAGTGKGFFCRADCRYVGKVEVSERFFKQLNKAVGYRIYSG